MGIKMLSKGINFINYYNNILYTANKYYNLF